MYCWFCCFLFGFWIGVWVFVLFCLTVVVLMLLVILFWWCLFCVCYYCFLLCFIIITIIIVWSWIGFRNLRLCFGWFTFWDVGFVYLCWFWLILDLLYWFVINVVFGVCWNCLEFVVWRFANWFCFGVLFMWFVELLVFFRFNCWFCG